MATMFKEIVPTTTIRITQEFVEFYLSEAGFNPTDFNIDYLTHIWREAAERGVKFDIGYQITADSVNADDDVFCQALNTFDWPETQAVFEKFYL